MFSVITSPGREIRSYNLATLKIILIFHRVDVPKSCGNINTCSKKISYFLVTAFNPYVWTVDSSWTEREKIIRSLQRRDAASFSHLALSCGNYRGVKPNIKGLVQCAFQFPYHIVEKCAKFDFYKHHINDFCGDGDLAMHLASVVVFYLYRFNCLYER
jgi:hypothetical protein